MPATKTLSHQTVRELLLQVWGRQACRNPAEWAETLERLMCGNAKPAVDEAVAALASAFADGLPADPVAAVWVAFPKLHREHCAELATALTEASRE